MMLKFKLELFIARQLSGFRPMVNYVPQKVRILCNFEGDEWRYLKD